MQRFLRATSILALTVALGGGALEPGELHFALSKSAPEDGAAVTAVDEVRLWFTQVPQDGSISIRLIDGNGDLAPSGDVETDPEDGTVFFLPVEGELTSGDYTVAWRGIGQDGHTVRGDFAFSVSAR